MPFPTALLHGLTEHFSSRKMRNIQILHKPLALRAFAGSRWPNKDNPHE